MDISGEEDGWGGGGISSMGVYMGGEDCYATESS
jgi:hypothetical protein